MQIPPFPFWEKIDNKIMNYQPHQDHPLGISTLDTGFMRPYLAASHLLIENHHATFIDVGTNHAQSRLLAALQAKQIPLENVDYVIVTHIHLDHAGGAGSLLKLLPNAQLVVHPLGARHLIEPSRLIASATAVYGKQEFQQHYGNIVPIPSNRVLEMIDETVLDFQGRSLVFLDTPGHARHHFCVYDERSQSFFTGDTFGISYREFDTEQGQFIFAAATPIQFEPLSLHRSIDRLLSYHPHNFYLTHYGQLANLQRLSEQLHQSIDQMVNLTQRYANCGAERHTLLSNALFEYFWQQLQQLNSQLSKEHCRSLLALDVELNTQGLTIWWDKKMNNQPS